MENTQDMDSRSFLLGAQCARPVREESSSEGETEDTSFYQDSDEDSFAQKHDSIPWVRSEDELYTFGDEVPPGPAGLYWVDGNVFMFVASIVICANMVTMVIEALNPDQVEEYSNFDQFCMCFYIVELVLKAALWQTMWLVGPCPRIAWNWLDFVIVATGCIDMYIMPLMTDLGILEEGHGSSFAFAPFLRVLRLLRLARVLKILKIVWRSDLSWTEGERFQLFMMCVIGASCIIMGFEADFPKFFLWYYLEQIALAIFTFELVVRLKNWGWQFFCKQDDVIWNWLDFVIVVGGVVDQWMMPTWELFMALVGKRETSQSGHFGKVMMLLRMARLLRILRLVRLIKNIPPLFSLLKGITQAMAGMLWVLLLTSVLLYACTLLCVKLVRDGIVYGGEAPVEVVAVFPNVPDTFFTLFSIMNGNTSLLEPVFSTLPLSKLVYAVFTIISSWAILSVLTAVVSENMINSTEELMKEEEAEKKQQQLERGRNRMEEIFDNIDHNGDGRINFDEFIRLLENTDLREEVCKLTQMTERDLKAAFAATVRGKWVSKDKFMQTLEVEDDMITVRTVLRLETHLEALQDEVAEVKDLITETLGRPFGKSQSYRFWEGNSRTVSKEPASLPTHRESQDSDDCALPPIDELRQTSLQRQQTQQQAAASQRGDSDGRGPCGSEHGSHGFVATPPRLRE